MLKGVRERDYLIIKRMLLLQAKGKENFLYWKEGTGKTACQERKVSSCCMERRVAAAFQGRRDRKLKPRLVF